MSPGVFLTNSLLLGVGLAMDAFSVSIANGLSRPEMKRSGKMAIAGTFAGFQFLMPVIGWACVHAAARYFATFQKFVPWIALLLLLVIGIKMIADALGKDGETAKTAGLLLVQGVATSIDALSVGFAIADYRWQMAILAACIIALVTYGICRTGLAIGIRVGSRLNKASGILGGCILIFIGVEIFVRAL